MRVRCGDGSIASNDMGIARTAPSARLWSAAATISSRLAWPGPEAAHRCLIWVLRHDPLASLAGEDDPILSCKIWDHTFPNPLGLAAGFDKNGEVVGPMLGLGLGFVEVGSITPLPQPGNPRPRVFRLPEEDAVINRLGFNNQGMEIVARRLSAWRARKQPGILGINLGKNKESKDAAADYAAGARHLGSLADYLVVNVSSPNTPGLRALQGAEELRQIVAAVHAVLEDLPSRPPLLLKIAPDLDSQGLSAVVDAALALPVAGLIVSNTTTSRPADLRGAARSEAGGLSGRPLFSLATECLSRVYKRTGGNLPLIGVGGVASPEDAYAKIRAGANLVQLYTALAFRGARSNNRDQARPGSALAARRVHVPSIKPSARRIGPSP